MNQHLRNLIIKAFPKQSLRYIAFTMLIKYEDSYLYKSGWMKSLRNGKPVDDLGLEIPWMNFPIITFLNERLHKEIILFEYGSGQSTLFYAKRVKSVTSVEHDEEWYKKINSVIPPNVKIYFVPRDIDGNYCRAVKTSGEKYNFVVIDGTDRINCIKQSLGSLTPDGVILLDDSEWEKFYEGILYLTDRGFRRIDFEGLKPCEPNGSKATIFYRNPNCMGL